METTAKLDAIYIPSKEVVVRDIVGELIIVPLVSGIGDMEDAIFTLNEVGKVIWNRLDGKNSLRQVVSDINEEYRAPGNEIERDIIGFIQSLLERKIIVEIQESSQQR